MTSRRALIALASVLVTILLTAPAAADHFAARISLTISAGARAEVGYILTARVQRSDGKAIGSETVRFYDIVDLFGPREMLIGSTTTDATGRAELTYLPATAGERRIVALYAGSDHISPVRGQATLHATVTRTAYEPEPAGLALFSSRVPYVVGVVVLIVWALIAYAFISTVRGILTGARSGKGGMV